MVWQKNDDQYGISRKITRITRKPIEVPTRLAAVGLDQLAMNYSARHQTDGVLDSTELDDLFAVPALIDALVGVERWHRAGHDCARCVQPPENSIVIHDFLVYNPDAASVGSGREEKAKGGREGNHKRWHVQRGISVASCEWCAIGERSDNRSGKRVRGDSEGTPKGIGSDVASESLRNPPVPVPGPVPRQTDLTHLSSVSPDPTARAELDEEIESLAEAARAVGIRNLPRVMRALERVVGPVSPSVALDTTRAVVLLAIAPVKLPEPYLEAACLNSPETVRAEWKRVADAAPKPGQVKAALDAAAKAVA